MSITREQALKHLDGIVATIDTIAELVGAAKPIESVAHNAQTILVMVRAAIHTLGAGVEGDVTPEVIRDNLQALTDALRVNDAEADAALAAKFPTSEISDGSKE